MPAVTPPAFNSTYGVQEAEICNKALSRIGANVINDTLEDTKQSKVCKIVYGQTRDELLRQYPFSFAVKTVLVPVDSAYANPKDQYSFAYNVDYPIEITATTANGTSNLTGIAVPIGFDANDLVGRIISGAGLPTGSMIISVDSVAGTGVVDSVATATTTAGTFSTKLPVLKILEIAGNAENVFDVVAGSNGRVVLCNMYSEIDATSGYLLEVKYVHQVKDPAKFDSMFTDALALRIASKIAMDLAKSPNLAGQLQSEFAAIMQLAKNATAEERQIDAPDPWWTEQREIGKNEMQRRMS